MLQVVDFVNNKQIALIDLLPTGLYSNTSEISVSQNRLVITFENRLLIAKRPSVVGQKSLEILGKFYFDRTLPKPIAIDDRFVLLRHRTHPSPSRLELMADPYCRQIYPSIGLRALCFSIEVRSNNNSAAT